MKSKMNIRSIILVAILSLSSLLFINMSFAANTAKVKVETANLREQPSQDAKILELASMGEEVEVLEKSGDWYKVKYKNITGYVRSDLIEVAQTTSANVETVSASTDNNEDAKTENVTNTESSETESTENVAQVGKYKMTKETMLKITPLVNALDVQILKVDEQLQVTKILNNWAYVTTSDGTQGWVRMERLEQVKEENTTSTQTNQTQETLQAPETTTETTESQEQTKNLNIKMYVNSQTVNLREKADKTSGIVSQLEINTEVNVISKENGWCYVEVNNKKGYVSESLLSTSKQVVTSRSSMNERTTSTTNTSTSTATTSAKTTESSTATTNKTTETTTSNSSKGSEVIAYAKTLLGCKYVYGGTTTKGFDCSGFTQYVYKHFGVNLNRTAAAQYSNGTSVSNLQAGDLVMFGKSGINHVGIYIGGNTFIHAANPSKGVTTDTLSSGYYKTNYVGARRIY